MQGLGNFRNSIPLHHRVIKIPKGDRSLLKCPCKLVPYPWVAFPSMYKNNRVVPADHEQNSSLSVTKIFVTCVSIRIGSTGAGPPGLHSIPDRAIHDSAQPIEEECRRGEKNYQYRKKDQDCDPGDEKITPSCSIPTRATSYTGNL